MGVSHQWLIIFLFFPTEYLLWSYFLYYKDSACVTQEKNCHLRKCKDKRTHTKSHTHLQAKRWKGVRQRSIFLLLWRPCSRYKVKRTIWANINSSRRAEQVRDLCGRVGAGSLDAQWEHKGLLMSLWAAAKMFTRSDWPDVTLVKLHSRENRFHVLLELKRKAWVRVHTHTWAWVTHKPIGWQSTSGLSCTGRVCVSAVEEAGCLKEDRRQQFGSAQHLQTSTLNSPSPEVHVARYNALHLPKPSKGLQLATLISHYLQEGPHDIMALARQEASRAFLGNELFWSQCLAAARQRCAQPVCGWPGETTAADWFTPLLFPPIIFSLSQSLDEKRLGHSGLNSQWLAEVWLMPSSANCTRVKTIKTFY